MVATAFATTTATPDAVNRLINAEINMDAQLTMLQSHIVYLLTFGVSCMEQA